MPRTVAREDRCHWTSRRRGSQERCSSRLPSPRAPGWFYSRCPLAPPLVSSLALFQATAPSLSSRATTAGPAGAWVSSWPGQTIVPCRRLAQSILSLSLPPRATRKSSPSWRVNSPAPSHVRSAGIQPARPTMPLLHPPRTTFLAVVQPPHSSSSPEQVTTEAPATSRRRTLFPRAGTRRPRRLSRAPRTLSHFLPDERADPGPLPRYDHSLARCPYPVIMNR
jgi:hypothetical protein